LSHSSGKSLGALEAVNHELKFVKIIRTALKNERERILYSLENYYNKQKVKLYLIEGNSQNKYPESYGFPL
jgi:hypothetical protein